MRVGVIGGGASGMMAAGRAAELGASVTLFERNEKLGKKIYITGKGRCNMTNDCTREEMLANVLHGEKFLFSSISRFSSEATISFFESRGVAVKIERGNRAFPVSDKASDVIRALETYARSNGVEVVLNTRVCSIVPKDGLFEVKTEDKTHIFDKILIATGGKSYPKTGSDGDGYAFAKRLGHTVVEPKPSLVPILLSDDVTGLQGLSLKNVCVSAERDGKTLCSDFGEMLFTSNGVSGPTVLSLSAKLAREKSFNGIYLTLDLKPALSEEQLDKRILRDFSGSINRQFKNGLNELLPKSLIPFVINRSGIYPDKQLNAVTKEERAGLVALLKNMRFRVSGLGGFNEAVITSGGVSLSEVNPKTLESKTIKGLYFCGEVLDLDAYTGGFNLQIAFSTGFAAGESLAAPIVKNL